MTLSSIVAMRLAESAAEDRFSGAVLIRGGAEVLLAAGFGEADRQNKALNTPETRFRLGSAPKMFTATAAMRLVQDGSLDLRARVGDLLPQYPNLDVARTVTVHQLLSHTSGLGNVWGAKFDRERLKLRTCADYVSAFAPEPLEGVPGGAFHYSSYGYILLGRIMEVVTGVDFHELVRALVFEPAGMADTGAEPEDVDVPNRAVGYMRTPEGWRPAAATLPYRGTPAGGGYSTIHDLDRFATALLEERLLDGKHTRLLTTSKVEAGEGQAYGYAYGFMIETDHGLQTLGHSGAAPGMAAIFRVYPGPGWRIIVLTNRDAPAASMVATYIGDQLVGARQ